MHSVSKLLKKNHSELENSCETCLMIFKHCPRDVITLKSHEEDMTFPINAVLNH